MKGPPKFVVIDGTPAPETDKQKVRKRLRDSRAENGPYNQLSCHRCSGIAVIEIKLGMIVKRGQRPSGGTKQIICATCFKDGEMVTLW